MFEKFWNNLEKKSQDYIVGLRIEHPDWEFKTVRTFSGISIQTRSFPTSKWMHIKMVK